MKNLLPARGCVYSVDSDNPEGFYSVEGLSHGHESPTDRPILIQSVTFQDQDISSPITTLSGKRVIYRFGRGVGNMRVSGELLMGPAGSADSANGQASVIQYFNSHRLSARDEPSLVTLPGGRGLAAYFTGLVMAEMDPNTHTQPFGLLGYLVDTSFRG